MVKRKIVETAKEEAEQKSVELAGCYVPVSHVAKEKLTTERIHDNYMAL